MIEERFEQLIEDVEAKTFGKIGFTLLLLLVAKNAYEIYTGAYIGGVLGAFVYLMVVFVVFIGGYVLGFMHSAEVVQ